MKNSLKNRLCVAFITMGIATTSSGMEEEGVNPKVSNRAGVAIPRDTIERFVCATVNKDVQGVESVLRANPGIVNQTVGDGITALHMASFLGHSEIVDLLLNHGADVSFANTEGRTALGMVRGKRLPLGEVLYRERYEVTENLLEAATKWRKLIVLVWLYSDFSDKENPIYQYPRDLVHIIGGYM